MEIDQGEQGEGDTDNPSINPEVRHSTKEKYNRGHIVIPYTQGLGESIKHICKRYGIQTHFKGNRTVKNILVRDKDPLDRKSGAIYWYQCGGSHVMRNIWVRHLGPLGRDIRSISKNPHPSMDTATFQDIAPTLITSSSEGGRTMALPEPLSILST